MRVRTILGFGVGYVLGARAGRQRYEQMKTWWVRASESSTAQALASRLGQAGFDAAKEAAATGLDVASEQLRKLAD